MPKTVFLPLLLALALPPTPLMAADPAPWGTAPTRHIEYKPHKVIYDLVAGEPAVLANILDRASYLDTLYGAHPFDASIVIIVHGDALKLFGIRDYRRHAELMQRAQSLTVGGNIEFRMCAAAARREGYTAEDIHGFVTMIPMADAEIVRLQVEEGYAYMR